MNESVKWGKKTRQSCAGEGTDGFTFSFVEELKVKANSENIWYFSTTRSVGKVIMEKKIPPPPLHAYRHHRKINLTAGRCRAGF